MRNFSRFYLAILVLLLASGFSRASIVDESFKPFATKTFLTIIYSIAVQPDGKYLVGGVFATANGRLYTGLARFNSDHSIDLSFQTPVKGTFYSLIVLPDGKILVGGSIEHRINNINYQGIARLHPDGSVDQTFLNGTGSSGIKTMSVQPDGKIIVGGNFSTISGVSRWGIARLNSDGSIDSAFNANIGSGWVHSVLALPDGKILFGGETFIVNGQISRNLALVESNGTLISSFSLGLSGTVHKIKQLANGKILVGGRLSLGGSTGVRIDVVRLNSDYSLDESFFYESGIYGGYAYDIEEQPDGKILIGGNFNPFGGGPPKSLLRVNENGSIDSSFNPLFNSLINAVAFHPTQQILVGGSRPEQQAYRNLFYRLDIDGNVDSNLPISFGDPTVVGSLSVLPNGKIYIVGDFTEVNGRERKRIARLNANGTLDTTFNSTGTNDRIFDVAVQPDGKVIICGQFGLINGVSSSRLARLNYDGSLDPTFNVGAGADNTISEVGLQPDGKILISGVFQNYNNIQRIFMARLNSDGSLDTTFDTGLPGLGNSVNEIVVQPDGKILIGGWFPTLNNVRVGQITRLNPDGSRDLSFNVGGLGTTGPLNLQRQVNSIALQPDGKIYIGGLFQGYNNVALTNLARLNADGSLDQSFMGNTNGFVAGIRRHPGDGKYLVGGVFTTVNGVPQKNHFRLNADGSLDTGFDLGTGPDDSVIESAFQPNGDIISVGVFKQVDGYDRLSIVRLKNSTTPLTSSKPFDFDGDGKTDISVFRPANGQWWINQSVNGAVAHTFGNSQDKLVPADFTGDGRTDVAIFRPSSGEWFILRSEDFSFYSFPFGASGDIPVVGDFDGDGKADAGVFRPSNSTWYISKSTGGTMIEQFGAVGDLPVPADYDGDGQTDLAVFRPSLGQWWLKRSTSGVMAVTFGNLSDKPVPGDYTGDGKTDVAIWRPSTGEWFILRSEDSTFYSFPFGAGGDQPSAGDYDGDGKWDAAVFRPLNATWYLNQTTAGLLIQNFGLSNDRPVPNVFVP